MDGWKRYFETIGIFKSALQLDQGNVVVLLNYLHQEMLMLLQRDALRLGSYLGKL